MIRKGSDHITKKMEPLSEARVELIPTTPGSDWRDLPNKVVKLVDGSLKIINDHDDVKQGRGGTGAKRGVCACADGKSKCDVSDRQDRTLIPCRGVSLTRQEQPVGRPLRQSGLGRLLLHHHHQPGAHGKAGESPAPRPEQVSG